jgi:hypothetical protein
MTYGPTVGGRPRDWAPLADADPLPGDPEAILRESTRLRDLAEEMKAQISQLRRIGSDDSLVGEYAVTLRTASADLAGKLEQAVGRYERVSGHLRAWAPELLELQRQTLEPRATAKEAAAIVSANTAMTAAPVAGVPGSPEELAAGRARQAALLDAEALLQQARRRLDEVMTEAHRRGKYYADLIDDATDDDLKDGRWDNFKDWVDRNKGWIKATVKALSYVATAVAVVAIFVPGVNLLALTAIGLTALVTAGHSVLAASGNGSWFDVGLDLFALATFGAGRFISMGIRNTSTATRTAASTYARHSARAASLRANNTIREAARRTLASRGASTSMRRGAQAALERTSRQAARAGTRAASEARHAPAATYVESVLAAGRTEARQINHTRRLITDFSGVQSLQQAGGQIDRLAYAGRGAWIAGAAVDSADKWLEDASESPGYESLKNHPAFHNEWGSSW